MGPWVPQVQLPRGLDELRGPARGVVYLPLRVTPNAPFPELVEWHVDQVEQRVCLYEIVLRDAELRDLCAVVNGPELVALWDSLYLPAHVREAWQPLIDAARRPVEHAGQPEHGEQHEPTGRPEES